MAWRHGHLSSLKGQEKAASKESKMLHFCMEEVKGRALGSDKQSCQVHLRTQPYLRQGLSSKDGHLQSASLRRLFKPFGRRGPHEFSIRWDSLARGTGHDPHSEAQPKMPHGFSPFTKQGKRLRPAPSAAANYGS